MPRLAVLGDLSGHLPPFLDALGTLGVDLAAARLPDDLTVIQVGDLVHKGPDSNAIVELVDGLLASNPGRYVQLRGNHEDQYLGGPRFYDRSPLSPATVAALRGWQAAGQLHLAAAIVTNDGAGYLVTHAGLTHHNWRHHAAAGDPAAAARLLNDLPATRPKVVHAAGIMLHGQRSATAGPLWAEAVRELYPGWLRAAEAGQPPPFGQIHGHCPALDTAGAPNVALPSELAGVVDVDPLRRHSCARIGGRRFIGVDPGFEEQQPAWALHPAMFDATLLAPR